MTRFLITGASGFVGGHVADACAARGHPAVALVRPGSNAEGLERPGVSVLRGELHDAALLRWALEGVDVVVHAAAKVGDWGPVDEYRAVNVEGTRHLLEACQGRPLRRFVYLSTLGVYEARHHHGTDESEPPPERHMDGYTQSKVEAERLVLEYHQKHGVPVTVLRPGFIYGPRDRTLLPTVAANLKRGVVRYVSRGRFALNTTYVGNLVDAIFLAAEKPAAVGQVYNITDNEPVTRRVFFRTVADGLGLPRPGLGGPVWIARPLAGVIERRARRLGWTEPPRLTQARIKFLGLNLEFSIEKAKRELGYEPRVKFAEGMAEALAWYKAHEAPPG
jgi:2-alkyl-3-oxoalkanoate reductase